MIDVIIIGCGIVGAATAYELSKYKLRVLVLESENDIATGATKANSGIIHAGYDPKPGTLMAKLNIQGSAMSVQLCEKLGVGYNMCGSLVLAFCDEDLKTLDTLYDRGIENGVPNLRIIDKNEILKVEPNVNQSVLAALFAPSAAVVSPWGYTLALANTAVVNNVVLKRSSPVTSIDKTNDGFSVRTPSDIYNTRYIINAAGVNADTIHNMVATPEFSITPVKGQYYLLDKNDGNTVNHVIFQCPTKLGKGALVASTVHGNLIVGPDSKTAVSKDDLSVTEGGLCDVALGAKKSVPYINFKNTIRHFAGIRAVSDSVDDFIIKEAADASGFIDVAAIKSPGLSAAPAIAVFAVELLQSLGLQLDKKSTHLIPPKNLNLKSLSIAQKQQAIQNNPAYGRIICRCETVSEGEIIDAIKSPIPPMSIDGIKRRCGAGFGRCQGGFCTPKVIEIMARELGVSPHDIPLELHGSNILPRSTKGGDSDV